MNRWSKQAHGGPRPLFQAPGLFWSGNEVPGISKALDDDQDVPAWLGLSATDEPLA